MSEAIPPTKRLGPGLRWGLAALAVLLVAGIVHVWAVQAAPKVILRAAIARISGQGRAVNRWVFGGRMTEASRGVVRPSPDLAYATCVYDLSQGPVRVTGEAWGDYMSVSVYDASTDAIFVADDRTAPKGVDIVLALKRQATPRGAKVVVSPSPQGIVLDRRLAPTPERFAAADKARRGNTCGRVGLDFPSPQP